jgi:hypothetical protein
MWFGINASVIIGPGFLHTAGFGKFLLPHPPVVNWLLRLGLPEEDKYALSVIHEFGHLQTTPPAVIYTLGILGMAYMNGHTAWPEIFFMLVSTHAAWEIMAEGLTVISDISGYSRYYKNVTVIPRSIFWCCTTALVVLGWNSIMFA